MAKMKKAQLGKIIKSVAKSATKKLSPKAAGIAAAKNERKQQVKSALNKAINRRTSGQASYMDEFDVPVSRGSGKRSTPFDEKNYKKGGTVKKQQAGGVTKVTGKAPDKKGDYITVQKRTLGNMKNGGKAKKK